MASETEGNEVKEEPTVWQYQLRDKSGEVIGDWVTPAEGDFKWPKHDKKATRWLKKDQRWQQVK